MAPATRRIAADPLPAGAILTSLLTTVWRQESGVWRQRPGVKSQETGVRNQKLAETSQKPASSEFLYFLLPPNF